MIHKRWILAGKYWLRDLFVGIGVLVLLATGAMAQEVLTPEQAIRIGLEENYAIRIAKNEVEIAENNNSLGNAGFLPRLNANVSQNTSITTSEQTYLTGQTNNTNDAQSKSVNSGVSLDWTVFDGLGMFTTKNKLEELESQGKLNARMAIESTIASIVRSYYDIVRQQKTLMVLQEALEISRERVQVAKTKKELGSGSGLELLQAHADFNSDKKRICPAAICGEERQSVFKPDTGPHAGTHLFSARYYRSRRHPGISIFGKGDATQQ